MSPRYDWPDREFNEEEPRSRIFWALFAIGIAAFLGVLVVTSSGSAPDCKGIADNDARLACFDAAAQAWPAKNAAIPTK